MKKMVWAVFLMVGVGLVLVETRLLTGGRFLALAKAKLGYDAAPVAVPTVPAPLEPLHAEGKLASYPGARVVVSPERSGILTVLAVNEKQSVQKGQLVAALRSDDIVAQLAEADAKVHEIEADLHLFQSEAQRYNTLYAEGVGTRQAKEKADRDVELAEARLVTQRATIQGLHADLAKTKLYAPISGVVLTRHHQQGESVDADEAIVTLADLSRTRIEAEIDEFDAARVKLGAPVTIRAEGYSRAWRGHVQELPDQVEARKLRPEDPGRPSDTRVLLVKVAFDEPTPLKLGQRVEVEISPGRRTATAHD